MLPINKNSIRIPSQLPEFIRDDLNYETFVAFAEAYYEWLELSDASNAASTLVSTTNEGVTFGLKNLQNYSDVDSTLDNFMDYYTNDFLPNFPIDVLADKAKLIKVAKQLYQAKGTPASYKLLFRVLYNSDAEILLTGELVFRASAAEWYVPKYLKIKTNDSAWLSNNIKNLKLFGETSKSFAIIDNTVRASGAEKYNLYISQIERLFVSGEYIRIVDSNNQDVYFLNGEIVPIGTENSYVLRAKIVGAISSVNINSTYRGTKYRPGDPVVVYGGLDSSTGIGATAQIAETTSGSIQRLNLVNPGYGYRLTPNSSITFTGGGLNSVEARAHIQTISQTNQNLVTLLAIDRIYQFANSGVTLDAFEYGFISNPAANASTTLANTFNFISFVTAPIDSVIVDNGGGGYSDIPSVSAQSLYSDIIGNTHDLASVGILAPIEIINAGVGYLANDEIIFSNASGIGAYANVTSVSPDTGAILEVSYVYNYKSNAIYPLGGIGYTNNGIPKLTINSANVAAHGANVYIPAILGTGATFSTVTDRIGAITRIQVINPGEDFVSTPNVSFRVQDLIVTNPTTDISSITPGTIIFQGVDNDIISENDIITYQSFVDSIQVVVSTPLPATTIYRIRVYNYSGFIDVTKPLYADIERLNPYPRLNLNTTNDAPGSFQNGVFSYGDGAAKGIAKFAQGLVFGEGRYLTTVGHPSSYSVIQSDINNDFTYILSVEQPISKYRDLLKKLLHPAGTRVIGRDILKSQKHFDMHGHNGQGLIHPIQYWLGWPVGDPAASVSMNVSSGALSTNTINVSTTSGTVKFSSIDVGDYIMIDYGVKFPISSTITGLDPVNNVISIQDNIFLTFPNVAYGYANTIVNCIQVSDFSIANTPNYDIINNKTYTDSNNHMKDIVFIGDNIIMGGNTFVVRDVDYVKHFIYIALDQGLLATDPNAQTILTENSANNILLGQYLLSGGTKDSPIPFTINRVINTKNAYIRKQD